MLNLKKSNTILLVLSISLSACVNNMPLNGNGTFPIVQESSKPANITETSVPNFTGSSVPTASGETQKPADFTFQPPSTSSATTAPTFPIYTPSPIISTPDNQASSTAQPSVPNFNNPAPVLPPVTNNPNAIQPADNNPQPVNPGQTTGSNSSDSNSGTGQVSTQPPVSNNPPVTSVTNPAVNVNPVSGSSGTTFTFNASGLTPNGNITVYFLDPGVPETNYSSAGFVADNNGNYTASFKASESNRTGIHKYWIVDNNTGIKSNVTEYTINQAVKARDIYTIRMLQVDDEAAATINGKVYKTFWGHNGYNTNLTDYIHRPGDSGDIDITADLISGNNELKFVLVNSAVCCGYALNIEIRKNGMIIYSDSVAREDSSPGIKYEKSYFINI